MDKLISFVVFPLDHCYNQRHKATKKHLRQEIISYNCPLNFHDDHLHQMQSLDLQLSFSLGSPRHRVKLNKKSSINSSCGLCQLHYNMLIHPNHPFYIISLVDVYHPLSLIICICICISLYITLFPRWSIGRAFTWLLMLPLF